MSCNTFEQGQRVKYRHGKGTIHCEVISCNKREVTVKVLDFENFQGYSKKHWKSKTKTLLRSNKNWDTSDGKIHESTILVGGVPVFRFNAEMYDEYQNSHIPEKMEGFQFDPELCRHIANTINYRSVTGRLKPMIIDGKPGIGKTEVIRQVFHQLNRPLIEIGCNGRTNISTLIGRRDILKDGSTAFTYGVLPKAMKLGMGILLDEFDAAPADVNLVLHTVAQDGILMIPEKNETIKAHKDFCIFATGNTFTCTEEELDMFERNDQDEATKRRFYIYRAKPISEDLMIRAIYEGTELSLSKARTIINVINEINDNKGLDAHLSMREAKKWAKEFVFYDGDPFEAAEGCIVNLFREPGQRELVKKIIADNFKRG